MNLIVLNPCKQFLANHLSDLLFKELTQIQKSLIKTRFVILVWKKNYKKIANLSGDAVRRFL